MGLWGDIKKGAKKGWEGTKKVGGFYRDITPGVKMFEAGKSAVKGDLGGAIKNFTMGASPALNIGVMGAKKLAAEGAAEAAAKQSASTAATGTTPKTELSPVEIKAPENISTLSGSDLLNTEQKAVLAARQAAMAGMTPEEAAMRRSQMGLAQGAAEQARQRQLASGLARSGVRGGAAAAAQSRAAQLAAQERAAQAQELQLADEQRKREALTEMEKTVGGLTGEAGKRQFMGLAADIAGKQLGVARETGQLSAEAIGKYADTMNQPQERGFLQNMFGGLF